MKRTDEGFTLVELLIVVVIIGILAAVALPKFSVTRDRAYLVAMQSDLKQVMTMQELYHGDPTSGHSYWGGVLLNPTDHSSERGDEPPFPISLSPGVRVEGDAEVHSWYAVAEHDAAGSASCDVFVGASGRPSGVRRATLAGVVVCGAGDQ